jgi:hypothetical protein
MFCHEEKMDKPPPKRCPRQGWEEQFLAMHEQGDDQMIEGFPASTWDEEEWEW